jgi:tripartite-type tricarboxylate transporter receptor subunit TctC
MNRLWKLLALLLVLWQPAAAQENFPDHAIRILVPNSAGGPTDVLARLIADEASKMLGQEVLVENRVGAAGQIAARAMLEAPADGYTLMMGNTGVACITPLLYSKAGYSADDFAAISMVTRIPIILVVRSDLPANSIQELMALMKSDPKAMKFTSPGVGQSTHMAAELFRLAAGTKDQTIIVPTHGNSESLTDLLANTAQGMFDVFTTLPQIKNGTLKALGVAGSERSAILPDVPTMKESGLDNFNITSWYVMLAKAGTPPEVLDKLNKTVIEILKRPDVQERMAKLNSEADPTTSAEAQKYLVEERDNWKEILKRIDAKPLD